MHNLFFSFKVIITKATAQTVFFVAILFFQLDKCLRVARRFYWQSNLLPHTDDVIVFGLKLFEEIESPVAQHLFLLVSAVSKQHGDSRIDHKQIDGTAGDVFLVAIASGAEGVVGFPIWSDL